MVSVGGFEPPVSCVRGRRFRRAKLHAVETDSIRKTAARAHPPVWNVCWNWRARRGSNSPATCSTGRPRHQLGPCAFGEVVGPEGVEPSTLGLRGRCAADCATIPNWYLRVESNHHCAVIGRDSWPPEDAGDMVGKGRVERHARRQPGYGRHPALRR